MAALPLCGIGLKPKPHHGIVHFNAPDGTVVSLLNDECYECSFWDACVIDGPKNEVHVLTNQANSFQLSGNGTVLADGKYHFGNLGEYIVRINATEGTDVETLEQPTSWLMLYFLAFFAAIFPLVADRIIELIKSTFWRVADANREYLQEYNVRFDANRQPVQQPSDDRVLFVDALRGYAIVLMIFVNYGGGGLPLMAHSAWYGLTIADIIFPLFIYCSGLAVFINHCHCARSRLFTRSHSWKVHFCCMRLVFLGTILSNFAGESVRVPGVLQRIAFTIYVFWVLHCGLTMLLAKYESVDDNDSWWQLDPVSDCLEVGVIAVCGLAYAVIYTLPITDCPIFYQGPGGTASHGQYFNCTGGNSRAIDVLFIHEDYLYNNPTNKELYRTDLAYDPEGVLGSIAACMTLGFGYLAGRLITLDSSYKWMFMGSHSAGLFIVGLVIHIFFAPMCKNTWNFSFVLVNAAIHNCLLTFLYVLQFNEDRQIWRFKTLCYIGKYSLLIYICHEFCVGRFPVQFNIGPSTVLQMLNSTWGVFVHVMLAYIMNWGRFKITFDYTCGCDRYRPLLS